MFLSGIDIGGTSIKFGIFDEQLNLLQQWSRPKGEQHIRYAVAQQDGQELGQGAFIQLRVKALAAVAVQVNQSGC